MTDSRVEEVLTAQEIDLVRRTLEHFLANPDYATGEEDGLSFDAVAFGDPLPLEIVLRDWEITLNDGDGGRTERHGDCYQVYVKLYERGLMKGLALKDFLRSR